MKVDTQIWLDRNVIKHVVWLFNGLVRIVGKILRLDHDLDKEFKTIAVAKYKGMGSIIHATPLLLSIREKHPNAKIIFVSTKSNKSFLDTLPMIDECILLDESSVFKLIYTFPIFIWSLIRLRIEVFIDLEIYAHLSGLITTLSTAKNRLGYYMQSGKYRHGIYTHLMYFNPKAPMSQVYLQMARLIHCDHPNNELYDFSDTTEKITSPIPNGTPYIVINPNASDLCLERRWPVSQFKSLINLLIKKYYDHDIYLVGAPSEAAYTDSLCKEVGESRVQSLAGKTNIPELIKVVQDAAFMISNDTGPLHMAIATKTKTVGLFGPIAPTQFHIPPYVIPLYKNVYCSPCVHEFDAPPCNGNNICMKQIEVFEVINAIDQLATIDPENFNSVPSIRYSTAEDVLGIIKRP